MDADERLTALKKAYADIILNTAKEAAARIMVSERKALRFEYELKNAKEDALQMLLRLKQMMDFKVNEAAATSCTQQKKIEELEAQLQEAEDIVKDLREELRAVEAELERFPQSKQVKHPVQVDNPSIPESPVTVPSSEVQPNLNTDQTNKIQRRYNSLFPIKKSLISNGDLPSIILRSKETELYRNGCTQRIRACERTPPEIDDTKTESIIKEDEIVDKLHKAPSVEEKEVVLDLVKEMDLTTGNSCLTSPSSVKHVEENFDEGRTIDEDLVRTCNGQSTITEKDELPQSTEIEKDELPQSTEMEVDPQLKSLETKVDLTTGNSCLTSPTSVKHVEENSDEGRSIDEDLVRTCNGQSTITEKDELPQSTEIEKDELPQSTEMEVDPQLKSLETKVPSQPLTDRVIKYTFQRKRKRGALTNGSASSERSEENQTAHLVSEKANLTGEPTPEKICLQRFPLSQLEGEEYLSVFYGVKNGDDIVI